MVGGGCEKKTLRLARYADACNVFGTTPAEVARMLDVLRTEPPKTGGKESPAAAIASVV